jgi:hypothetical protein
LILDDNTTDCTFGDARFAGPTTFNPGIGSPQNIIFSSAEINGQWMQNKGTTNFILNTGVRYFDVNELTLQVCEVL